MGEEGLLLCVYRNDITFPNPPDVSQTDGKTNGTAERALLHLPDG